MCSSFVPLEPLRSKISLSGSKEEEGSLRTTAVTYSQSECLETTKGPIRSQRCQGQIQKLPVFIYKTSHIVGYRERSCICCSKDKHVHLTHLSFIPDVEEGEDHDEELTEGHEQAGKEG